MVISENRLTSLRGNGLSIETRLVSALIEDNIFNSIEANGLIMLEGSSAGSFKVLGNELIKIGTSGTQERQELAGIHLRNVFEGAVSDNVISEVGLNSPIADVIAGVRVDSSLDVRISDNTITNIAPASTFRNPAAGVLVFAPIVNIEIADNLIRRQIPPNDFDNSPWQAIHIEAFSRNIAGRHFSAFGTLTATGLIGVIETFAAAAAAPQEQAGIHGNSLHGYGGDLALVEVSVSGPCRFSDNQCSEQGVHLHTAVDLAAGSIIASANRVECIGQIGISLNLNVPDADKKSFTVLGNIVGAPIMVNGVSLQGTPWEPLNVIA
jgi:hypothetical protein